MTSSATTPVTGWREPEHRGGDLPLPHPYPKKEKLPGRKRPAYDRRVSVIAYRRSLSMTRPKKITLQQRIAQLEQQVAQLSTREGEDRKAIEEQRFVLAKTARAKTPQVATAPQVPAKVAKGSSRVPVISAPPPALEVEVPLAGRLEALLRAGARTYQEILDELGDADGRTGKTFAAARRRGDVADVGTPQLPRYVWVIGDNHATPELRDAVEKLVRMRPITFAEIVTAVGANPNRIKGVLTDLQKRDQDPLRNFGTKNRALWFIPPR